MKLTILVRVVLMVALLTGCESAPSVGTIADGPFVTVLGVAQDAGYPQAACRRACCITAWADATLTRQVSCLGIVDPGTGERWLIDATPDFRAQLHLLDSLAPPRDVSDVSQPALDGIFLTHAHVGHYTGLQNLGREITGASSVPVYAMPRMRQYLESNGPWSQLVELSNIELHELSDGVSMTLNERLTVTALLVPHRDEFSETVGYRIQGPQQSVLYIPDIDKWERWSRSIEEEIRAVDVAYLDGTFYRNGEIAGRDMADIPHPFIEESMARLAALDAADRQKVRFLHFNHTNPVLWSSKAVSAVQAAGFDVALERERVLLGQ